MLTCSRRRKCLPNANNLWTAKMNHYNDYTIVKHCETLSSLLTLLSRTMIKHNWVYILRDRNNNHLYPLVISQKKHKHVTIFTCLFVNSRCWSWDNDYDCCTIMVEKTLQDAEKYKLLSVIVITLITCDYHLPMINLIKYFTNFTGISY